MLGYRSGESCMTARVVKRMSFGRATRMEAGAGADWQGAWLPPLFLRPTSTGDSVEIEREDESAPDWLRQLVPVRALRPTGRRAELWYSPPQPLPLVSLEPAPG